MVATITHKPPAPGETYINPFTTPIYLLDANGNPTGYSLINETHTPVPVFEPLQISVPADITVTATSPAGAVVFYTCTASGGFNPPPTLLVNPPSGSTFPIGTTTVTATASDAFGDTATGSFTVTVNTPPIQLTVPADITVTATSPAGAVVFYTVSASGGFDPPPTLLVNPPSGSTFPIGTTTVTATASDAFGDTATGSFTVTVKQGSSTIVTNVVNPSVFGQTVTFTATVSSQYSGTPTGTVTFREGSTSIGTSTVSGGVATFTTAALTAAAHTITAVYGGDTNFAGSTSATVVQVVNAVQQGDFFDTDKLPPLQGQYVTPDQLQVAYYANGVVIKDVQSKLLHPDVFAASIGHVAG